MLVRLRRSVVTLLVGLTVMAGALVVPATTAAASPVSTASCHHQSIRNLPGFLNEERFVRHYRSGSTHYHVVQHINWYGAKHNHTVKCGYYRTSLVHY